MKISDILRIKGSEVCTVRPETTVREFLHVLVARNIGACVISEDCRTVIGIASERDVAVGLALRGEAVLGEPVSSIATVHVYTTEPDETLEATMKLMTQRRIRHVPVLVDGELAGIVSLGDIVARRVDELEAERRHLADYIASG